MKTTSIFLLLWAFTNLTAQVFSDEKSVSRAVVIGISDYQDENIPDLRFAHKDAEAFVAYLKSNAGGSLSDASIRLLTNEKATIGQIGAALEWLVEVSQKRDKAIIYFSGHGDVENKTMFNLGYLLCWDSPPKTYMAGAVPLNYLQAIISTLSTHNQSEVILITDACRAGKLAGSSINGTQLTNANLSKQFANEIKILSCQPNEYSVEGEQWGGGRGAFSYHLVDGLKGLADNNADFTVNVREIDNYLEEKVSTEVNPQSQFPMVIGNKTSLLAYVNETTLQDLQERRSRELPTLALGDNKHLASLFPEDLDSTIIELYDFFVAQIEEGNLLEPKGKSAYDIYIQLVELEEIATLHGSIRRNMAAALQDESQQAVNAYLRANPRELRQRAQESEKYAKYPEYIRKAAEILGPDNFFYKPLLSKLHYFEGLQLRLEADTITIGNKDSLQYLTAIELQEKALNYQSNAPYILNELGVLHTRLKKDSLAFDYYNRAIEISPEWGLPYVNYSIGLYYTNQIDSAITMGEKAGKYLPKSPEVYSFLAWINAKNWEWKDIMNTKRKGTELIDEYEFEPDFLNSYGQNKIRLQKSLEYLDESILQDSTYANSYFYRGVINQNRGNHKSAVANFQKFVSLNPESHEGYNYLAFALTENKEYNKAISSANIAIELSGGKTPQYFTTLGRVYVSINDSDQAYNFLTKGAEGAPSWETLLPLSYFYSRSHNPKNREKAVQLALNAILDYDEGFKHPASYINLGSIYSDFNISPNVFYARNEDSEWLIKKAKKLKRSYPDPYLILGQFHLKNRDYKKAIINYEKAIEIGEDELRFYHVSLGQAYYWDNNKEKAKAFFEKVKQKGPWYLYSIGWFYKTEGEYELAIPYLKKFSALKIAFHTDPHLAAIYHQLGKFEEAVDQLEFSLSNNYPKNQLSTLEQMHTVYSFKSLSLEKARLLFKEREKKYPGIIKVFEFLVLMEQKEYAAAVEKWEEFPKGIESWYFLHEYAGALTQAGYYERALSEIEKAYDVSFNYHILSKYSLLVPLHGKYRYKKYLRKRYPYRFDDLNEYNFESPEPVYFPKNCILLGQLYERHEEWLRAEFHYHKAMELQPDSTTAFYALQTLYQEHPEVPFEKTEAVTLSKIKQNPDAPESYATLANWYNHTGETEKAFTNYRKAIENSTDPKSLLFRLGNLYQKVGDFQGAKSTFDTLSSYNLTEPEDIFQLASAYLKLKEKTAFRRTIDRGIDLQSNINQIYYIAKGFVDSKQREALEYTIQKGIEKNPENNGLYYNNACLYALAQDSTKAIEQLGLAIQKGYKNYDHIRKDNDLEGIREIPKFKALMEKHFPDAKKE